MNIPSIAPDPQPLAQIRTTSVDLGGLMSVLSKHLYSTPMVALRELVQNAHDSILRRRLEQPDWRERGRIEVLADAQNNLLRIIDTGAGLTEHEIHAYLATVGVGYTRRLRESGHEDSGLIGMFGLGFLSAFVLAKRVSVRTTSYQQPELGHVYLSTTAEQYSVNPIAARAVGTEIILELQDEYRSLTSPARLDEILRHYCALLPEPIHLCGSAEAINPEPPPWRRETDTPLHPVQAQRRNLEFAARFERSFEPICTMDVRPGEGDASSDARGLLWVQDGATYGTSDNRNLAVFVRGMLLDDDARDLLPSWAGFIGGVIESNRLTPTASREDLQRDAHYSAVRHALSESLIDGLGQIVRTQPEAWRRILLRHNEALLGASLCDERLFLLMMEHLRVPTSQGQLRVPDLISRGALHVILESQRGFEAMLFRTLGIPVAHGHRYAVVPFLRRWAQLRGLRLVELGTEQGNRQLFRQAELPEQELSWLREHLCQGERLQPAHFEPAVLPLVVVPDRDSELKRRLDADANDKKISLAALRLARQFTAQIDASHDSRLYLNLSNPAVDALLMSLRAGSAKATTGARLLRTFKTILASHDTQAADALGAALEDLAESVHALLRD